MTALPESDYLRVQHFLFEEARLLDANEWEQWLSLFAPDGFYWMPAAPGQTDPLNHVSLIYDDAILRQMRCKRLSEQGAGAALSLQPQPRCMRMLTNLRVQSAESGVIAHANLVFAQYGGGPAPASWYARVCWELRLHAATYLIQHKRVELLNCDGALTDILAYL